MNEWEMMQMTVTEVHTIMVLLGRVEEAHINLHKAHVLLGFDPHTFQMQLNTSTD
jgi:hypothetical protein